MRSALRLAATLAAAITLASGLGHAQRIEITVPATEPLHGHLVLIISRPSAKLGAKPDPKATRPEPRFQLSETYDSAQGFGVDVDNLAPGKPIVVDASTLGYPRHSLADLDSGDYLVQAVFNRYELFHLASGHDLWLPPDKGEGQHWNRKPGNNYNAPVTIHLDPHLENKSTAPIRLTLDKIIPPIEGTPDDPAVIAARAPASKWLRYTRFRSEKLSRFYGRDMYLGAWVLLPDGFDEHPAAHYPVVVYQDHYHADIGPQPFVTSPPDPATPESHRQQSGYRFFQDWTSGRLPRVLLVYVQNANPFYDDSYVVDSANVGPYGSAINEELLPSLEATYRGIPEGWAHATFGGSTGGWEALATQVLYPDLYNGAWVACPDPVNFHAYQNIDLYSDPNAFNRQGDFGSIPIPADRHTDGSIIGNTGPEFAFELVLGTHGRSTEQWNIWQAVFSPVGPDGYPASVIDPLTGAIDKSVVQYWHDHYDLAAILDRDWPTLGPKLEGKLHLAVGDADTYFLNNAVHLLQTQLEATRSPHSDATCQYGPGQPHCYTGGPSEYTMRENNAMWTQRVLPLMADHMLVTAPPTADTKSWRY